MAQSFTSSATSINKERLPAVYRKASLSARIVMDYGSGKYTEHIQRFVNEQHRTYLPFDPYNQPDDRNAATATLVCNAMYMHLPVDVICSNVLNVIDDDTFTFSWNGRHSPVKLTCSEPSWLAVIMPYREG